MKIKFEYTDEFGVRTALEKDVDSDYMGCHGELGILNECYRQFLQACTFCVTDDDCVVVIPKEIGWDCGWYKGEF